MKNLSVRAKLSAAFGLLTVMVMLASGWAIFALSNANDKFETYVGGMRDRVATVGRIRQAVDLRAIAARNLVIVTSPQELEVEKALVKEAHAQVTSELAKLKQLGEAAGVDPKVKAFIAEIDRVERAYAPVALAIVEAASSGRTQEAIGQIEKDCRPLLAQLIKTTSEYAAFADQQAEALVVESEATYSKQRTILLIISALALIASVGAGVYMVRSLEQTLGGEPGDLRDALGRIAAGDLTGRVNVRKGDTGSVVAALGRMQTSLVQLVAQVRQGAEGVATASAQIAQGNQDLSARTEQQASALEETSASMEEMGSTAQQNADNARAASQLAQSASSVAEQGGEVVSQVVSTMREIQHSSQKINDIIGTIDGIAFQTNILALNAAVEAARAGEQGRGFAVVAGEVRTLAQRSAEAAKEIKLLINASVERVEQGTTLVDQAGSTMQEVVQSIQRVTDIVGEISSASQEQNAGVNQVSEAVSNMDQTTQQNAALVEESASAAASLRQQADQLVKAVSAFRTDAGQVAVSGPVAAVSHAMAGIQASRPSVQKPAVRPPVATRPVKSAATVATSAAQPAPASKPASRSVAAGDASDEWESF